MIVIKPPKAVRKQGRKLVPGNYDQLAAQLAPGETVVAVIGDHAGECAIALMDDECYAEYFGGSEQRLIPNGFYAVALRIGSSKPAAPSFAPPKY